MMKMAVIHQNANVANAFLTEFIRKKDETEKFIKFDSSQMRDISRQVDLFLFADKQPHTEMIMLIRCCRLPKNFRRAMSPN